MQLKCEADRRESQNAIGPCLLCVLVFLSLSRLFCVHNYFKINARQGNRQLQLQLQRELEHTTHRTLRCVDTEANDRA